MLIKWLCFSSKLKRKRWIVFKVWKTNTVLVKGYLKLEKTTASELYPVSNLALYSWWIKANLMSLAILFYFLCAQRVSDINISITRNLRLFCWITTLVILFLVRCVLEFRCGWVGVVSVLQAEACNTNTTPTQPHRNSNTHRTKNNMTNVVIQQNSRKLLMLDTLMPETCWVSKK